MSELIDNRWIIMSPDSTMPRMGRKRQPQKPEFRRTYAGRIGARLAELADSAGMSADELGKSIKKSGDSIRLYFAGEATPHVNDWPNLASALGVTPRDLLPE